VDYKTVIASSGFRQIPVTENEVLRNRWQDISFSAYTNGVETMVWGLSPAENDRLRGLKSNDLKF
jgi:hypothetical protein